jgi:hypothetical protein
MQINASKELSNIDIRINSLQNSLRCHRFLGRISYVGSMCDVTHTLNECSYFRRLERREKRTRLIPIATYNVRAAWCKALLPFVLLWWLLFLPSLKQACRFRRRKLRSKIWWFTDMCNSHYVSHFAAFFIVQRAKISIVKNCVFYYFIGASSVRKKAIVSGTIG